MWSVVQVLCGTERLLAVGRQCGLRLQCHATASTEATAAVVSSVARAWLEQWRSSDPGLHYAVAEQPTEEESFLTRSGVGRAGGVAAQAEAYSSRCFHAAMCNSQRSDRHEPPVASCPPTGSTLSTHTQLRCCCRRACRFASCCRLAASTPCRPVDWSGVLFFGSKGFLQLLHLWVWTLRQQCLYFLPPPASVDNCLLMPQMPRTLGLLPRHCLELLSQCAASGAPALGIPPAGSGRADDVAALIFAMCATKTVAATCGLPSPSALPLAAKSLLTWPYLPTCLQSCKSLRWRSKLRCWHQWECRLPASSCLAALLPLLRAAPCQLSGSNSRRRRHNSSF